MRLIAFGLLGWILGCASSSAPPDERVVVALTMDWEGAYIADQGLGALADLRAHVNAPVTHFVCPAYLTKRDPDPDTLATLREAVRAGDELAVHLHGWASLAQAAGIAPRTSPSFLSGTDDLVAVEDDRGFDLDPDAYDVAGLRALVRTTRALLERTGLPVSRSFRAGGYLATPKLQQAIRDEGFTVDSSAIDYRQLDELGDALLPARVHQLWPTATPTSQPWVLGGGLLEMPIGGVTDYATAAELAAPIDAACAKARAQPGRKQFVVLAFHLEDGEDFTSRLRDAVAAPRSCDGLVFTTLEHAAELARAEIAGYNASR